MQVEDTKHEKSEKEDENQEDIKEDKEGIEMTDDFECKKIFYDCSENLTSFANKSRNFSH